MSWVVGGDVPPCVGVPTDGSGDSVSGGVALGGPESDDDVVG